MKAGRVHVVASGRVEQILNAARELFIRQGLRRTSLAQIADQARVAPATLYRLFANRETLVTALLSRETDALLAVVDASVDGIDDPEEGLVAAFLTFVRALREHDLLQELIALDRDLVLPLLTTEGDAFLAIGRDYLAQHLVRARDQGAVLTADPEVVAEIFARVAHSLILTTRTVLPMQDDSRLAELARETFARLAFVPG